MRPLTANRPKVMLPVAGKPLLEHVLLAAKAAGVREAALVVHYKEAVVRSHFGDGAPLGMRLTYVHQAEPRGTGDAVLSASEHLRGEFLILSGDTLLDAKDVKALAGANGFAVGAKRVDDPRPYVVLVTRGSAEPAGSASRRGAPGSVGDDTVERIVEKSPHPPGNLANVGAYKANESLLAYLKGLKPSERGEIELTDAFNAAARERHEVRAVPVESWIDVGRPWDLLAANEALLRDLKPYAEGTVEKRVTLSGPVVVAEGAVVKDGSYVEGPVIIGAASRVGPNAYLRAGTVLVGKNHVGASSEVKNSILLEGANAPHLNYVGDSILGARVNLGAGTVTANLRFDHKPIKVLWSDGTLLETGRTKFGAVVGDDAQTGINVTLNVGAILGEGALVGPARRVDGYVAAGARLL
jgi:bifunctional UDP-N-acetylglucosamine pyrophosphorylase/glucosamine-1-phosphate N-acetyltransferase